MRIFDSTFRVGLGMLIAAAFSACATESQQGAIPPRPLAPVGDADSKAQPFPADHSGSWMAPGAAKDNLLYVTNTYDVTVYSYPSGKLVGKLKSKDLFRPLIECSDNKGNVFISEFGAVLEYAHAGTKLLRTLSYSGTATGCGSDPTTGNLCVVYQVSTSQSYAAVYKDASGTPTVYQDGSLTLVGCAYDPKGNLYVDGSYYGGSRGGIVELPKGSNQLETINLNQSLEWSGEVQWDGKYVAVGDDNNAKIYRISISGSEGTVVDTVSLGNTPAGAIDDCWIQGNKVIAGNAASPPAVLYWDYPAGGSPVKSITKGLNYPAGVTVSIAPK